MRRQADPLLVVSLIVLCWAVVYVALTSPQF